MKIIADLFNYKANFTASQVQAHEKFGKQEFLIFIAAFGAFVYWLR